MLDLDKLSWQIAGESRMSGLIIGGNFNPETKANPDTDALATIEIARRIEFVNGREEVVRMLLRIAGVTAGNKGEGKRIIAATYDLTDPNRLAQLNVSVTHEEFSSLKAKAQDPLFESLFQGIFPTTFLKEFPYAAAGLVTDAMHSHPKEGKIHFDALVVRMDDNGNAINVGPHKDPYVQDKLHNLALKVGYRIAREYYSPSQTNPQGESFVTVSYGKEDAEKRGLSPWKISIPDSLR